MVTWTYISPGYVVVSAVAMVATGLMVGLLATAPTDPGLTAIAAAGPASRRQARRRRQMVLMTEPMAKTYD
jgi:hypothetical protein